MGTMKAAMVYGKDDLRLVDMDIPQTPENSIRIRVKACSICGTDRRIYKVGDFRAQYPVVVGHEIAAVVDEVKDPHSAFNVGDRVVVAPGHGCGYCAACKSGYPNVCTSPHPSLGYALNGGFAEYMAVPEHIYRLGFVNKIPESLSFAQATMSEIIACCINAQDNVNVQKGDTVLILGAGPAGIIHAILSKLRGASKVIIAQRSRFRLDQVMAKFSGVVDAAVCMSEQDLKTEVLAQTAGLGANVVLVCAPSKDAQELALDVVTARGRVNFFGGLPKDNRFISLDSNSLHYKEFFVSGASSSRPENNKEALALLDKRLIDPDLLITHHYSLADIKAAFDVVETRECIKVVVNMG